MIRLIIVPLHPCPKCGADEIAACYIDTRFPKRWFLKCKRCNWCGKTRLSLLGAQIAWNRQKKEGDPE